MAACSAEAREARGLLRLAGCWPLGPEPPPKTAAPGALASMDALPPGCASIRPQGLSTSRQRPGDLDRNLLAFMASRRSPVLFCRLPFADTISQRPDFAGEKSEMYGRQYCPCSSPKTEGARALRLRWIFVLLGPAGNCVVNSVVRGIVPERPATI